MEIEITTTKKKLSKSLINQMRQASKEVLTHGETLGYLINVRTGSHKILLITCDDEFFIIPTNYTKGEMSVYRRVGKWSSAIRFESPEACNSWWTSYQARLREAVNQIYI